MEEKKGEDFLTESKNFFNYYKKEVGKFIRAGKNVIFLHSQEISSFSPILAEQLMSSPEEIIQVMELALEESGLVANPRIRLLDLPEMQFVHIRNIRAKHLNSLISIEGLVRQASDVRPQVVNAKFECPSCGTIISVLQIDKKFREPSRCSCGRKGQFNLVSKEMVDAQRIVIEESPENLTGGEQPRRISVFLKEDLVEPKMEEKTTPGSRVRVIGVLKEVPVPLQTGAISTRFDLAVEANNVIPLEETFQEFDISEEDERQIKELASDKNLIQKMIGSIAPSIYGYEEIKEILVFQLFGGVKKKKADGGETRGDIHVLLVGDPGVAKSVSRHEKILYFKNKEIGYESVENLLKKFGKTPKNLSTLSINMSSHKAEWKKVFRIIKHKPEKKLIEITTEHGKKITATKDHSFITLSEKGEIVSIKGDKLTENSYIPIPFNYHKEIIKLIETEKFNTYLTNSKQLPKKIALDEKFGFFIGIFLSEGSIEKRKCVSISNKNKKIQEKIVRFAKQLGLKPLQDEKRVIISSKSLSNLLEFYCYNLDEQKKNLEKVKGNYSRIKKIPEFAFFSPREFVKGLVSGIFSGDGRFIKDKKRIKGFELVSVSKELAHGTSDILFSVGIINRVIERQYHYQGNKTDYYIVSVSCPMIKKFRKYFNFYGREYLSCPKPIYSYHDTIPCGNILYELTKKLGYNQRINGNRTFAAEMRIVKKRNKIGRLRLRRILKYFQKRTKKNLEEFNILKKIAYSPIIWSKINKIKIKKSTEDVYDLSIPGTNTFVANGVGVHNSQLLKFMSTLAPKGRYIVGSATSGAGITATVVRDEFLKGWSLEAGAMVLANKGLLCVDEIDKMGSQDRSAMHEALEQQCMLPDFKLMLSNGKSVKIGELVDSLMEKNKSKVYKGNNCEVLPVNNIELLSTDFASHFPINASRVSRHIAPDRFIKIILSNGREITVTPEHPCWVVKNGEIITIPAEKLTNKDYFSVPSSIELKEKPYKKENDILCKILGYHISDGCYEINRRKKTGIQFWNNDIDLIKDYKFAVDKFFGINSGITKRRHQFAVRAISKKIVDYLIKLDATLLEKGVIKKIPNEIMNLPKENIKYLLRALFDGDGTVVNQARNGCRVSLSTENLEVTEQVSDLLLRFGITSSIFKDKNTWKIDISGQENLSRYLINISFLCKHKKQRLKNYCSINKTYRTIKDIIPNCTSKINEIFKKLKISAKHEIGHSIDLGVEKQRLFLQKLVLIAERYAVEKDNKHMLKEIEEIKKLAFGFSRWMKIKSVEKIKNKNVKWVYDVTIEPYHTFISNGMILHNTVTISKANVQACLRAETSLLAAANPKLGRFEPFQVIAQQIDMPPTLINRFDVIFTLRDMPDRARDEALATHLLLEHKKEGKKQIIDGELFRKYIAYAKQKINPELSSEAIDELKKFYVNLRNAPVSAEGAARPVPISARQLDALIRLSEASARARLNKKVKKEDALRAIALMKFYLMQVGYDYETKTFDIDRIATGVSTSQRGRVILVREALSRLESRMGKLIPIEELEKELEEKMSKDEISDSIQRLKQTGDIFEPKKGYVQRV